MQRTCPKCGHVNPYAAGEEFDRCPAPECGLIYSRYDEAAALRDCIARARQTGNWTGVPRKHIPAQALNQAMAGLVATTTQTVPGYTITEVVDVVSAECAYGMNLIKDFFANITDVVGGRSDSTQKVLRDARRQVLAELRAEAFALEADAVVGVRLDFNEFSGGGKSMLFVVATGTAVKIVSQTCI